MAIVTPMCDSFSPLSIPGCALWLEADYGVDTVDGKVSLWRDRSGNGRHVSQADDTNRPAYTVTGIGGHPSLTGTAADGLTGTISVNGLTKASMTIVFTSSSPSTASQRLFTFCSNNGLSIQISVNVMSILVNGSGGLGLGTTGFTSTAPTIATVVFNGTQADNATRASLFINGAAQSLDFGVTTIPTAIVEANTTSRLGCYSTGSTNSFLGAYSAFALYFAAHETAERQRIERHYSQKYGIALAA